MALSTELRGHGADSRSRTGDLPGTNRTLSRLSYVGMEPPKGVGPLSLHYQCSALPLSYGGMVPLARVELA